MARSYSLRFPCGHPGCPEVANFESPTRAYQTDTYRTYGQGKWRCTRHSRMDELLTLDSPTKTYSMASDLRPHGVYWGNFGFVSGPGFKAFAKDFPPGTVLRVTAEIVLPEGATPPSAPTGGE